MQTLLPECSGALSIAPLGRGLIEDGLSVAHVPLPPVDLGAGEREPLRELRPRAAISSATLAESTDSRLGAATSTGAEGTASDVPAATHLTESEFVLALPMTLSARETVARAKEHGLTISEPLVYKVRYEAIAVPEPAGAAVAVTAQAEQTLEVAAAQEQVSAPEAPEAAPLSKAAFIRGLPMDLRAKEVVARGKEQGLTFSVVYVRDVRAAAKARATRAIPVATVTPAASSAPPAPATPALPKSAPTNAAASKADFVRSLPPEMSFAEASRRATDAGISLSSAHFYAIKSRAKQSAPAAANSKPGRKPAVKAEVVPAFVGLRLASDDSREQAVIDAVRVLGVSRARAVIDVVETFERVVE